MKSKQPLSQTGQALVEAHMSCVHWTIRHYIHANESVCGLAYDDLYQEGCEALCHAAASYDGQGSAQFHTYAIAVIRNHLLDYCRRVQAKRKRAALVSLDSLEAGGAWEPAAQSDPASRLYVGEALAYGKRAYSGTARLGIEALELKAAGYTVTDIARLYRVQPNLVGAWISRAVKKLKKDRIVVENGALYS